MFIALLLLSVSVVAFDLVVVAVDGWDAAPDHHHAGWPFQPIFPEAAAILFDFEFPP